MLSNVTHSNFYFECNKERGPIDQLYIELGNVPYLECAQKWSALFGMCSKWNVIKMECALFGTYPF